MADEKEKDGIELLLDDAATKHPELRNDFNHNHQEKGWNPLYLFNPLYYATFLPHLLSKIATSFLDGLTDAHDVQTDYIPVVQIDGSTVTYHWAKKRRGTDGDRVLVDAKSVGHGPDKQKIVFNINAVWMVKKRVSTK